MKTITQRRPTLSSNAGLSDIAPLGQTRWVKRHRITAELDVLQAEVDALKHLQADTTVNDTGQAAAKLDALLSATLPPPPGYGGTGDRTFTGKLVFQELTDKPVWRLLERLKGKS